MSTSFPEVYNTAERTNQTENPWSYLNLPQNSLCEHEAHCKKEIWTHKMQWNVRQWPGCLSVMQFKVNVL